MKKLIAKSRNVAAKAALAASTLALTSTAFAIESTDIDAAYTSGSTVVAATVAGLIGLVALIVGVNIVMGLLKKG